MTLRLHPGISLLAAVALAALAESMHSLAVDAPFVYHLTSGAVVLAFAIVVLFWAIAAFRREHTSPEPNREPAAIVTSGPYRFSRNPMYVANVLLIVGFALLTGSAWFAIAAAVQFVLLNAWVIPSEEARLKEKYPDVAREWFSKTRRWL